MSATATIELLEGAKPSPLEAPVRDVATTPSAVEASPQSSPKVEAKGTTVVIVTTIAGVTTISSLLSGLITISLPVIAKDLQISDALLLW